MSSIRSPLHSHILSLRKFSQYFQFQTLPQKEDQSFLEGLFVKILDGLFGEPIIPKFLKCKFCYEDLDGSTSIYCCEKCSFYVHKSCATPPPQIQHPDHEHSLGLQGPEGKFFYYQCVASDCGSGFKLPAGAAMADLWARRYYHSILGKADDGEPPLQFAHEHPLTSFPARSRISCRACGLQISEAYGCEECRFFLHEACAKAPLEIQSHPFHLKHPLSLFYGSSGEGLCPVCDCLMGGISYRCEECELSFHMPCVISTMPCEDDDQKEDVERRPSVINPSLHPHQLSSYHSKVETSINCKLCHKHIPSGDFFGCSDCLFFLHESCAQPPMEIKHYLHPDHALNFAQRPDEKEHECSVCSLDCYTESDSYCYTCEECEYFIHPSCASEALSGLEKGEGTTVQCSFHEHELKLDYDLRGSKSCKACEGTISRGTLAYRCNSEECRFQIHKSCAQLPSKLEHPSHSLHPLTLGFKPPNEDPEAECRCCSTGITDTLAFSCGEGECNFYLHVACAQKPTLKHAFHEHILFHFAYLKGKSRPNFECRACLKCCNYDFLRCAQCNFTLHYNCSQSPSTVRSEHYREPLVLHESYKEDDTEEYYCEICEKRRDPNKWVYCSEIGDNPFIAHVECALSPVKLEAIEEDEIIRRKEDIQRQEEQIELEQGKVDAKEVSLRPLMVELESMRAKLDSQRADLEEMKTELAKWIDGEAIEEEDGGACRQQ